MKTKEKHAPCRVCGGTQIKKRTCSVFVNEVLDPTKQRVLVECASCETGRSSYLRKVPVVLPPPMTTEAALGYIKQDLETLVSAAKNCGAANYCHANGLDKEDHLSASDLAAIHARENLIIDKYREGLFGRIKQALEAKHPNGAKP